MPLAIKEKLSKFYTATTTGKPKLKNANLTKKFATGKEMSLEEIRLSISNRSGN